MIAPSLPMLCHQKFDQIRNGSDLRAGHGFLGKAKLLAQ
jgi:hypothetical protein